MALPPTIEMDFQFPAIPDKFTAQKAAVMKDVREVLANPDFSGVTIHGIPGCELATRGAGDVERFINEIHRILEQYADCNGSTLQRSGIRSLDGVKEGNLQKVPLVLSDGGILWKITIIKRRNHLVITSQCQSDSQTGKPEFSGRIPKSMSDTTITLRIFPIKQ